MESTHDITTAVDHLFSRVAPTMLDSLNGWQVDQRLSWAWVLLLGALTYYVLSVWQLHFRGPRSMLVGSRFWIEPRLVLNWWFFRDFKAVLDEGWSKAKGEPFWCARNDADLVVLPHKYVEEIRALPAAVANPTEAHAHNLLGHLTGTDLILHSSLHTRVIQTRLTPHLAQLTTRIHKEVRDALEKSFPFDTSRWAVIQPYHAVLELVARASAAAFVGPTMCRDQAWLRITTQFTENLFMSLVIIRAFPTILQPIVHVFLPTIWKNHWYTWRAKRYLVPEIKRQQSLLEKGKTVDSQTLLGWISECARGDECSPAHLAHLQLIISLASIHTTQMNAVHVLYDLAAHPEYVELLREEISEALRASGGWSKALLTKLRRLDSFMKESQRISPPSMLSCHRVMKQDHKLSDGTLLSKGSHICMPVRHIQHDLCPGDANIFDPFRYERLRQEPSQSHRNQFASTSSDQLNFGYGKYACPGRFFASIEIKTILVPLIMNYNFKLRSGEGRPDNMMAYEFIFPNPSGELLMRARPEAERINI